MSSDWQGQIFEGEKKKRQPEFGSKGSKLVPKLGFCLFLKFGSLVFLEIACNDSLQQCLTSSKVRSTKKNFGAQIWVEGAKIRFETRFFAIFSSLVH